MLTRLTLVFSLCFASLATAGAWPREKGTLFIAAGGNFLLSEGAQLPVHYDPTVYAEFGLTDRVTIGLDIYTADAGRIGSAFFFTSFPLGDLAARDKLAASLAYGVRIDAENPTEALLRAVCLGGADWTMAGLQSMLWRHMAQMRGLSGPKLTSRGGAGGQKRWTTSLQLQTGQGFTNDYYAKVAPSIIFDLKDNIKVHLGAVHALTGDRGSGLKLETWLTF